MMAVTPCTVIRLPVVCFLYVAVALSAQAWPLRFEAENGVLKGKVRIDSKIPGYSGSGYVTSFSGPDDAVDIKVNAPADGFYTMKIAYAAYEPKRMPVTVNSSMQGERLFSRTQGFRKMTFGRVALRAGENTVHIGAGWGWVDFDYIEIEPAPATVPFRIADRPVNRNASVEAGRLFETLKSLFGKKILAGQQDAKRLEYIADVTGGKAPAILGLDLLNYSGAYNRPDGQIERARDWVLQRHGIVTLSWHWFSPFGATNEVWRSFSTNKTTFDVSRIADKTSPEYEAVIRDMDLIADQLKVLRDAHVPVLWRPLHEAEGKWFWWGAKGPETARQLYRLMFDRFTRVHHLDNLIWVWTTTDDPGALEWYPGDDCVDIIGADLYAPDGVHGTFASVFDNLRQLYGGRKMIALCEAGSLPDPNAALGEGAAWLWFLIWDDFIERRATNPAEFISHVYSNANVVTLDTMQEKDGAK